MGRDEVEDFDKWSCRSNAGGSPSGWHYVPEKDEALAMPTLHLGPGNETETMVVKISGVLSIVRHLRPNMYGTQKGTLILTTTHIA